MNNRKSSNRPDIHQNVVSKFEQLYGQSPAFVVRAPGRVNIIGEHTDYNDGFVLPMAIDRATWMALRPRQDNRLFVHSLEFNQTAEVPLDNLRKKGDTWVEYLKGVAWALQEGGYALTAWEGVSAGDVPMGAGLSSSASYELATARAFDAVSDFSWDPAAIARLCQKAENQWVGVNSGIMDQMISASGKEGHALLIDCRSLETELVPIPPGTVIVVMDSATRRGLVGSAYNERRAQCEAAAQFFGVKALRDLDMATFEAKADQLDDVTRRRARHVITENERTLAAKNVMQQGDAGTLGRLMNESHTSMKEDFEITTPPLDSLAEIARQQEGCYGARMTGGGFGGCAVALVDLDRAEAFATTVTEAYQKVVGLNASIYICHATNGAEIL
ncbi:MAG: galactokinase [bacterium]|nr:galactokinase [bacterium]